MPFIVRQHRGDDLGHALELGRVGVIDDAERQPDAIDPRLVDVGQFLLEQFGVGHDHQLAGARADAGGLEPDPLDRAGGPALVDLAAVIDRVAAPERPVEDDRERREQVREDALRGEADGDAADAEAGDQGGDVDARDCRG